MNRSELAKFTMIKNTEERPGQFSSRNRAIKWCKAQKFKHHYILTTCYRADNDGNTWGRICWTTYLVTKLTP